MTDQDFVIFLERLGYFDLKKLPTGEWAGLRVFIYNIGLVVGLDDSSFRMAYSFHTFYEAEDSLRKWDGEGYPPGKWIKAKGKDKDGKYVDMVNPNESADSGKTVPV